MTHRTPRRALPRPAFTLMELLVVVAIIVMLAGVSAWGYMRYLESSRESIAKIKISTIEKALDGYKIENGEYPESLQVLTQPLNGKAAPLEAKDLLDPWGQPYAYEPQNLNQSTFKPRVYSTHPMAGGGQISNW